MGFYGYSHYESGGNYTGLLSVTEDSTGNLLFGHIWGATYYDGKAWTELPVANEFGEVFSVVVDNDDEYWLASRHLWKWNRDAVTVNEKTKPEPVTINVFPNPFNPSTTITYQLSERDNIQISIYNVTGQRVKQEDVGMQPQGAHTFVWDASDYSAGVYIGSVKSGKQEKRIKMLLLK